MMQSESESNMIDGIEALATSSLESINNVLARATKKRGRKPDGESNLFYL